MFSEAQLKKFSSIEEIFRAFQDLRVLIVGDVMIDSYLWGKVDRISPEAPVPILNVDKRDKRLGGAANVALNIQSLGAVPVLCSVIGDDLDGDNFITLLKQSNLSDEGILRSPSRITTIKHRVMSGSHHMLRVDQEIDKLINKEETMQLIERAKKLIPSCDVVIFEDYDKGVLHKEVISEIIKACKASKVPTVVDPKKRNFLHYSGCDLFKPNRKEMKEGLKLDAELKDVKEIEGSVEILKEKLNTCCILITLSEQGIFICEGNKKHLIPAHVREIADVSGAGDTVIGMAALCYAVGLPPRLLAELSNLAGGIVCEYVGVIPVNKELLLKEAKKLKIFERVSAA